MNNILLYYSIFITCLFFIVFTIYKVNQNKRQHNKQIEHEQQINQLVLNHTKEQINQAQLQLDKINDQIQEKDERLSQLQIYYDEYSKEQKQKINKQFQQEYQQAKQTIKQRMEQLEKQLTIYKDNSRNAANAYADNIDKIYQQVEKNYNDKVQNLNARRASLQDELGLVKSALSAAAAASLRQREQEQKIIFYQIQIPDTQKDDIAKIWPIRSQLNDPSLVSKIVWTAYIQKPTNDLCHRVLGTETKCGIYKITNRLTSQCYIGQSVDIATRWKAHIKCGLGIDASSTNKLYNAMLQDGVLNFSFELLEECERGNLDEKEAFWIDMYSSNKFGYNSTRGNK